MTDDPAGAAFDDARREEAEFQAEADEVYAELLVRIGEAAPQPRLEPTRKACELLGDPQHAAPVVHITGTNGKTSTARMIESILRATGLKTGLLTSPHLVKVNERIVIDGSPVSNEALVRNWRDIAPYLAIVDAELIAAGEEALSYFEALTVLGFAVFADAPVDVVVLEVGMGGEWDSTNVADGQVAVFTPIALDHQARLGNTIAEIARTKGGIIKPAAAVVSAMQPLEALDELRSAAQHDEASFAIEMVDFALESTTVAVGGQVITVRGLASRYEDLFLPLYGDYQGQNAALAIAAVESFLGSGTVPLSDDVLAEGLSNATSPGRLQLIGIEPTVFVDAAHNPHGARALAAAMTEYFDFAEITVVIAVLGDKDAKGIFAELAPIAERFHVTRSQSERAIPVDDLAQLALAASHEDAVYQFDTFELAVQRAREWALEGPSRAVLITGSITLVGEAIALAEAGGVEAVSVDETSPVTGRPARSRPRRERGVTETLLAVVLALEAAVLFFATLAINGLTDVPTAVVVGGGAGAIVLFALVAMLQRYAWGVVLGGALQVVLIATGLLVSAMYVVGVVFATLWIWCLVRARRIERLRRGAAEGVGA